MEVVKAPNPTKADTFYKMFLAGSIEMGAAENWQDKATDYFKDFPNLTIFNPRRDDWDSSWVQEITNPQFKEQVDWELDHLFRSNVIIFYFDPNTKSPITLLELGLILGRDMFHDADIYVCCPPGFWRRGNVEIVCERYGLEIFTDLNSVLTKIKDDIDLENLLG